MKSKNNQASINRNFSLQMKLQQLEKTHSLLIEELKLVALEGDLSENFDWTATILQIEKLRGEILLLKRKKMATANQNPLQSKIITYQSLTNKQNKTVWLTDFLSEERENSLPQVSFTSPLGLALANKKVGETSEIKTKKGNYWIKIINIEEK